MKHPTFQLFIVICFFLRIRKKIKAGSFWVLYFAFSVFSRTKLKIIFPDFKIPKAQNWNVRFLKNEVLVLCNIPVYFIWLFHREPPTNIYKIHFKRNNTGSHTNDILTTTSSQNAFFWIFPQKYFDFFKLIPRGFRNLEIKFIRSIAKKFTPYGCNKILKVFHQIQGSFFAPFCGSSYSILKSFPYSKNH